MSLAVRWARESDAADLALLLDEMQEHYRQPPLAEGAALAAATRWLAAEGPESRHFALAFDADGSVAGMASVAIAHPGDELSRLLFLKDLFVAPEMRGRGVGRTLMAFLARFCRDEGIGRIDLTTEKWNDRALGLYQALGAERQDQKVFLRFDREALAKLAAGD